ncbi:MAG: recombinase family protein [Pseudomonadota bacterium]
MMFMLCSFFGAMLQTRAITSSTTRRKGERGLGATGGKGKEEELVRPGRQTGDSIQGQRKRAESFTHTGHRSAPSRVRANHGAQGRRSGFRSGRARGFRPACNRDQERPPKTTVAIYARYSSDLQREASIEDQVRICRALAEKEGWTVAQVYSDASISAASTLLHPGLQALMQDASFGKFDLVVAEALDRISRSQADIAQIFERFQFGGIGLQTLSEGRISELHIGLKGTMNALFLKDLADKTRRGLRGRVEQGKSGGGIVYGYDVVTSIGARGEVERGERSINEDQATVVRRIFTDYANGISPAAIAKALNKEGTSAPNGGSWGPSTLYGNRERGTGILNNELYIGRLVWNRLRYAKDPATGKRVSRLNPESELLIREVPQLRASRNLATRVIC